MSEWKPIDSAPRDGGKFIGLHSDGEISFVRFDIDKFVVLNNGDYYDGGYGRDYATREDYEYADYEILTHWMPLPQPPK